MNKWRFTAFVLLLILLATTSFFLNKILKLENMVEGEKTIKLDEYHDHLSNFLSLNCDLNITTTGDTIEDTYLYSYKSDSVKLSDLLIEKKGPILIYKYSELNCNVCYETEIKNLHAIFKSQTDKEHVAILCSYRQDRDFIVFKKMNKIELPIYRIPEYTLNKVAEQYGNPYYFLLHKNLKISNTYMPEKLFDSKNKQYLESIKKFISKY